MFDIMAFLEEQAIQEKALLEKEMEKDHEPE